MGPTSSALRDDLITSHIPMATRIARSFAGRGEELDDLTQVAMLELVKAASRFDPARGVAFDQYAYPCIAGGIKKHFRDYGWSMHVTRHMQELNLRISRAIPALTQLLSRHPTMSDLAEHLHLSEAEIQEAMHIRLAYRTSSVNRSVGIDEDVELAQLLGGPDERLESTLDRHMLGRLVAALPARVQNILYLRYSAGLTQSEIAVRLGISQMHVSRLLSRCIKQLRARMMVFD